MVPLLLRKEARGGGEAATSYCFVPFRHDQRTEPVWRLCDRPLENFARPLPVIGRYPTLAGRGGSVSRRDHNQAYQRHVHAAWARKSVGTHKPIPSRSSGEGVWGGGASLREAASSPESPLKRLFGREREGGCFSVRKAPSLAITHILFSQHRGADDAGVGAQLRQLNAGVGHQS